MVSPMELAAIAGAAILLFGAERLPKLARSAGEMRREFLRGQLQAENEAIAATPPPTETALPKPPPAVTSEAKDHEQHPA